MEELILSIELKIVLELSALILGLVNGLFLLKYYLRDKPRIFAKAIYPGSYQWYFDLPAGIYNEFKTRKYGFLAYIEVVNKGLRDVSLESWNLFLKTNLNKWVGLVPISIPEPQSYLGSSENVKILPVLGQKGLSYDGSTLIKSGCSISGMAYYIAEFYGGEGWNPMTAEEKAIGRIIVKDLFGNVSKFNICFTKIALDKVKNIIKDIDKIDIPKK